MNKDPMVYQLIYTSSAKKSLDDAALREIALSSSSNNQELGITGLLMLHQGSILQVLEGEQAKVTLLYEKVKRDPRHTSCMILSTRSGLQREFSNWFMGYKNVSGHPDAEAIFNLSKDKLATILPAFPSPELGTLTKTYARVSGL